MNDAVQETASEMLLGSILSAIQGEGIDAKYLARKLKDELEATEVKVFKGQAFDTETKQTYDTLIYSEPLIAWNTRQGARKDAHKLLDQYPSEKREVTHNMTENAMSVAVRVLQSMRNDASG